MMKVNDLGLPFYETKLWDNPKVSPHPGAFGLLAGANELSLPLEIRTKTPFGKNVWGEKLKIAYPYSRDVEQNFCSCSRHSSPAIKFHRIHSGNF